ncbi:GNAT family N-acetyltransferase [Burkholderia sp. R-40]|uniref:GNAT family N-acetyltransferase n=1 Tax=Burkholderia sp. R-40 TaxID=3416709 RepID=UPI003CF830FD
MFDPHAPVEIVTLRDERASDVDAIGRVIVAAFADEPQHGQLERQIVDALRADGALAVSLVAERDERVVGHVAFSPVSIGGAPAGSHAWYGLGPLAVRPECRRQSIGAHGCVVLGDPAYYARFGFLPAGDLVFADAPREYFLALAFDEAAPRPSGAVRYHTAFYPA